jgi:hypothetical protein
MKTTTNGARGRFLAFLCALLCAVSQTKGFDCGSTGAYGPMNITNDTTLQLPPDGVFNCTTITVAQGATLRFTNNSLNTAVYLLATGDAVINGTIDVSGHPPNGSIGGRGGPGGFDGGGGGKVIMDMGIGGEGCGPGAGLCASYATMPYIKPAYSVAISPTNQIYGNILIDPLIGGSGGLGKDGSPGVGGAGGGGAILLTSNTKIEVVGSVAANGGSAPNLFGLGSGGAIRLVSPVVSGTGSLSVTGAEYHVFAVGDSIAGAGRVRIDCTNNQTYRTLNLSGVASRGSRMIVFPTNAPALDIIEVAGNAIAEGTNNAVQFELSSGASTNQTVKVQARNFTNDVPIRVVVTPENGPSGQFDAIVLLSSGNPPSTNVPVVIPSGSVCQIHAWTR